MQLSQIGNRWKLMSGYVTGQPDLSAYPITLIVENTAKCNFKCPMCPREFGYYPPEDFDFNLFRTIIDEIKGQTELVFPWGGGRGPRRARCRGQFSKAFRFRAVRMPWRTSSRTR